MSKLVSRSLVVVVEKQIRNELVSMSMRSIWVSILPGSPDQPTSRSIRWHYAGEKPK